MLKRSVDMTTDKRKHLKIVVQDCVMHRMEKDIMANSVSDSIPATGFR